MLLLTPFGGKYQEQACKNLWVSVHLECTDRYMHTGENISQVSLLPTRGGNDGLPWAACTISESQRGEERWPLKEPLPVGKRRERKRSWGPWVAPQMGAARLARR